MDFSWSDGDLALREAIVKFAARELNEGLVERDRKGEFSHEGWQKCAEFGIQGLPIPEEYGGRGVDILTTILALEALGYGCRDNGLHFAIAAHMLSCEVPIWKFGSDEQKRRYLPKLCSGEWIGVHAMTEPDSGSDAFAMQTRAERKGDRYVLNGRKTFITSAPVADLLLIFASLDPTKGARGITAFLVEKGTPGLVVGREFEKMGLRTSPMGELVLEDCEVSAGQLLGKEGAGAAIFNTSMEWERSCIVASQVGAMERQLERCVRYARERRQFGKPIGKFEAISDKLAEMKVRLETARLLVYKVGWLKRHGKQAALEAAMAKLYVSECCVKSNLDAVQIHGGYGYMTEFELERELRDSIAGTIYSGTSEIQRLIIAGCLGV